MQRGYSIRNSASSSVRNLFLFSVTVLLAFTVVIISQGKRKNGEVWSTTTSNPKSLPRRAIRDQLYFDYVDATEKLDQVLNKKREKRLPDIIGAGVEKCGTAAFKRFIMAHPMFRTISLPEAHYFNHLSNYKIDYYWDLMPEVSPYQIILEETPGYFHSGQIDLPMKMHEVLPNAKVYFILCHPTNRTFSDFLQEEKLKNFPEGTVYDGLVSELLSEIRLPTTTAKEITSYIFHKKTEKYITHLLTAGLYYYHVLRFVQAYNRSQIHFINGEDLITRPAEVIEEFQEFLGIPKLLIPEDFVRGPSGFYCVAPPVVETDSNGKRKIVNQEPTCFKRGKGRTRQGHWGHSPNPVLVKKVSEFYAPHNEKLFELIGKTYNWS